MLLLDTHVLIWLNVNSASLSTAARSAIKQARTNGTLGICDISLWEIAWLAERKRIALHASLEVFLRESVMGIVVNPVTPEVAALAAGFHSNFPRDPSDRLIAATALAHGVPLVTADEQVRNAQVVRTIW